MKKLLLLLAFACVPVAASAQAANPLWHEEKITNYLPHMSWPEVAAAAHAHRHGDHPDRGPGAAQPASADRHRLSERARAREADCAEGRRPRRAHPAAGQLAVSHGISGHDHALIADHSAGLFRGRAELDQARIHALPAAQQPRRQSDHHALHRRSDQPGDRGHRGGARRRRGAIPDAGPRRRRIRPRACSIGMAASEKRRRRCT